MNYVLASFANWCVRSRPQGICVEFQLSSLLILEVFPLFSQISGRHLQHSARHGGRAAEQSGPAAEPHPDIQQWHKAAGAAHDAGKLNAVLPRPQQEPRLLSAAGSTAGCHSSSPHLRGAMWCAGRQDAHLHRKRPGVSAPAERRAGCGPQLLHDAARPAADDVPRRRRRLQQPRRGRLLCAGLASLQPAHRCVLQLLWEPDVSGVHTESTRQQASAVLCTRLWLLKTQGSSFRHSCYQPLHSAQLQGTCAGFLWWGTVFLRLHNQVCDMLAVNSPGMSNEQVGRGLRLKFPVKTWPACSGPPQPESVSLMPERAAAVPNGQADRQARGDQGAAGRAPRCRLLQSFSALPSLCVRVDRDQQLRF